MVEPYYRNHCSKKGCKRKLFSLDSKKPNREKGEVEGVKRDGGWVDGVGGGDFDFEEGKAAVASVRLQCQL